MSVASDAINHKQAPLLVPTLSQCDTVYLMFFHNFFFFIVTGYGKLHTFRERDIIKKLIV